MKLAAICEARRKIIEVLSSTCDPLQGTDAKGMVSKTGQSYCADHFGRTSEPSGEGLSDVDTFESRHPWGDQPVAYIIRLSDGGTIYIRYIFPEPFMMDISHTVWIDDRGDRHWFGPKSDPDLVKIGQLALGRGTWSIPPKGIKLQPFQPHDFEEFKKAVL